jgi:hypothetical protein
MLSQAVAPPGAGVAAPSSEAELGPATSGATKPLAGLHSTEMVLVAVVVALALAALVAGRSSAAAVPIGLALLVAALACGFAFIRQDRVERSPRSR